MKKRRELNALMDDIYVKFKMNFYKTLFREVGSKKERLSVVERFCAELIYAMDGPTINELAEYIEVSQPNAAYKVNNLVRKGYIEKVPSQEDRREVHLYPTAKFQEEYARHYEYVEGIADGLVENLHEDEMEELKYVLHYMNDELCDKVSNKLDKTYRLEALKPLL